jgi:4-hydroxy 2-oxovalerate aldolase
MKILDVTLRDGGFVNDFGLSDQAAVWVVDLLDKAELDGVEIGYLTGLPPSHIQPKNPPGICHAWPVDRIAELAAVARTPLVGMLHPGGRVPIDFDELAQSKLRLVRITSAPVSTSDWREVADRVGAAGLSFTVNLTLASWVTPEDVVRRARAVEETGAEVFYVADTNGALLPRQVEDLFRRLRDSVEIPLGFHAHDCKRLALANVIAAERAGAEWVDSSLIGIGRGAGNTVTEVLHEIDGRGVEARYRLLRGLPEVARQFGVRQDEQIWQELCAFMDIASRTSELIEKIGQETGIDRYGLASNRLLGRTHSRLPSPEELRQMMEASPSGS